MDDPTIDDFEPTPPIRSRGRTVVRVIGVFVVTFIVYGIAWEVVALLIVYFSGLFDVTLSDRTQSALGVLASVVGVAVAIAAVVADHRRLARKAGR